MLLPVTTIDDGAAANETGGGGGGGGGGAGGMAMSAALISEAFSVIGAATGDRLATVATSGSRAGRAHDASRVAVALNMSR
ncbi:MAG TPA: hypothetical protein VF695_11855 [Sphingomonas sp.]